MKNSTSLLLFRCTFRTNKYIALSYEFVAVMSTITSKVCSNASAFTSIWRCFTL